MDNVNTISKAGRVKLDRPLHGEPHPHDKLHPQMYAAELVGTALLIFVGLSTVIALWGHNSFLAALPIPADARRLLNGFLFGSVGAAIAFSPIGKMSGTHINPAMTFAFWLEGKIRWRDAGCYMTAQMLGAALGAVALFVWAQPGPARLGGRGTEKRDAGLDSRLQERRAARSRGCPAISASSLALTAPTRRGCTISAITARRAKPHQLSCSEGAGRAQLQRPRRA